MEEANVTVTSRKLERSTKVAERINEEIEAERVRGVEGAVPKEVGEAIEEADIVLSAGAAGIQLLPSNVLREYGRRCKVVGDINAVPPVGVEGLKPTDDKVELLPGVWGIGALTIGTFKNKIEARLFKRAIEAPKGILDYKIAYEIAESIALSKL